MNSLKNFVRKIAILLFVFGFLLWFIETIYFIFVYGWHFEAVNEAEKFFDQLSVTLMRIGSLLWVIWAMMVVEVIEIHIKK